MTLKYTWKRSGRSMVAKVGPLTISVDARGSVAAGTKRWKVGQVFGVWQRSGFYENVEVAMAEAEKVSARLLKAVLAEMLGSTTS